MNHPQPILILTGMHRSGTSLGSSLLQSAGVNIGEKLVPANDGNPKGYFENADFVDFHEKVLFSLGIDKIGWTTQEKITPPLTYVEEAKRLIEENQDLEKPWGWKEPRTTLFLDFWADLLPDAYFIFVYRSPWEVLDSLYRRGDDVFHHNPELALQAWSSYNRQILRFYQAHPEKCLLFNLEKITVNPDHLIEMINGKFNLSLPPVDSSIYDASSLKTDGRKSQRPHLLKLYFPQIWEQYQELNTISDFHDACVEAVENLSDNAWVLQDWLNVRVLEKRLKQEKKFSEDHIHSVYQQLGQTTGEKEALEFRLQNTHQELYNTQQELQNTHQELHNSQQELHNSQRELQNIRAHLQAQLENTQQELHNTQSHLQQTQQELQDKKYELQQQELGFKELHFYFERSQEELKQTQEKVVEITENLQKKEEQLQDCYEKISFMETSKFWKMRTRWFKIKKSLGIVQED
jgi:DNA repair exonuclease SbcCD ATPase subunit